METYKIKPRVLVGRGNAARTQSKDLKEISKKFGIALIDGSLNLVSSSPVWIDGQKAIYKNEKGHFFWKAYLNDIPVIMNRWSANCPVHVFEIFAGEHLRSKFGLADGDAVTLEFSQDIIDSEKNSSLLNKMIWYLTWWGRERLAYRDDMYRTFVFYWRIYKLTGRTCHNPVY